MTNPLQPVPKAPEGSPYWAHGLVKSIIEWVNYKFRGPFQLTAYPANDLPSAANNPRSLIFDKTNGALGFSDENSQWQTIYSGTYTPTLTSVQNISVVGTPNLCLFTRVGHVVSVAGVLTVTLTTATSSKLGISLPVSSSLALGNVGGVASAVELASEVAAIDADTSNNRAQLHWQASSAAQRTMSFNFSYLVN